MSSWYDEIYDDRVKLGLRFDRVLHTEQSAFQKIEILETPAFGRVLALDGVFMTSERFEFVYHELITHPALTTVEAPRDVLVIGGGDGGTVREVLRHSSVRTVTMVEIDRLVVEACKTHLPRIGTAWDDPRLRLRFEDGIAYAKNAAPASFDAILLDGSDPVGPAAGLFSEAFLGDCRRALRPGGVFAMQSEAPMLTEKVFRETQLVLKGLYAHAHPLFAPVPLYGAGVWSWTVCTDGPDPRIAHPERIRALGRSKYYSEAVHASAFVVPPYVEDLLASESSA